MSYISVGFVCESESKELFVARILSVFDDEFRRIKNARLISFATSDKSVKCKIIEFKDMLGICFDDGISEIHIDFCGASCELNLILQIFKEQDSVVFQIFLPEKVLERETILIVEREILRFMRRKITYFCCAFCDHNAYLENSLKELLENKKEIFSILMINKKGKTEVKFAKWQIDGLSKR